MARSATTKQSNMQNKPKVKSIAVIPAYNECEKIGQVVSAIRESAENIDVLVIDDGSTDNTSQYARAADAKVIRLCTNMGYVTPAVNSRHQSVFYAAFCHA